MVQGSLKDILQCIQHELESTLISVSGRPKKHELESYLISVSGLNNAIIHLELIVHILVKVPHYFRTLVSKRKERTNQI